jgi:Ca-activated chloride channel family protein
MNKYMNKKMYSVGFILLTVVFASYCLINGRCSLFTADQQGYTLFKKADYQNAVKAFNNSMWQATAFFKNGEYEKAAMLFSGYDTPEAIYNQANAQLMLGKYDAAVELYQHSLKLKPDWVLAQENLEIALARLNFLKRQGDNMTGGMLAADEVVFDVNKAKAGNDNQIEEEQTVLDQAELQSIWLRQVQTTPADFLKAKFSYQYLNQKNKEQNK